MTTSVYEMIEMISQDYWKDDRPGVDRERASVDQRIPELRYLRQTPNSSLLTFSLESR